MGAKLLPLLIAIGLLVSPAEARRHRHGPGLFGHHDNGYRSVQRHKKRRNVLLGVGGLGLLTGSKVLTGIGLGGAAANELIDRRHRDY